MADGFDAYRRGINAVVRGLWSGVLDYYQSWDALESTIRMGIPKAFYEGASEVGVQPSELSPTERMEIERAIMSEMGYIDGLLTAVEAGSKENGGKLGPLMNRAAMWANRYRDVANRAKTIVGEDKKLKWVRGPTSDSCQDCIHMDGKVKRASQWEAAGIRPQSLDLECKGFNCLCTFVPTNEPMSKGPLPHLVGG